MANTPKEEGGAGAAVWNAVGVVISVLLGLFVLFTLVGILGGMSMTALGDGLANISQAMVSGGVKISGFSASTSVFFQSVMQFLLKLFIYLVIIFGAATAFKWVMAGIKKKGSNINP